MAHLILNGFLDSLTLINIAAMVLGVLIGMVFGAIPGLTGAAAMTILLPLTFIFPAETGVLFLLAIWNSAVYAGSIPAIVMNVPGTSAAVATTFDGYPMSKKGEAGKALKASIISSTVGAFVSALVLLFLSPPLAQIALSFGPPEMMAFAIFGMTIVVALSKGSLVKGFISTVIGLLFATIGFAPSGQPRFIFSMNVLEGVPVIVTLIGLFTFPEIFDLISQSRAKISSQMPSKSTDDKFLYRLRDWKIHWPNFARSSIIGSIIGIMPGAGPTIAGFVSYNEAKRFSKEPETFGTGNVSGVIAADTANISAVLSSLVPALTLGIPGSVDAVIIMAALVMHGLRPGPALFQADAVIVYTFIMGIFVCNLIMMVIGLFSADKIAKIARINTSILAPTIFVLALVGAFAIRNNWFDVIAAFVIGIVGYVLKRMAIPLAPIVLSVILGPIIERSLYQTITLFGGHYVHLFGHPIFIVFIAASILSLGLPFFADKLKRRRK